jgi:tetratricopeptide (TPR) repeat protein
MKLKIGLALLALSLAAPTRAAAGGEPVFERDGMILGSEGDPASGLLLSLWDEHVRFGLPPQPEAKQAELSELLERAWDGSRAVKIRFDGAGGRVNKQAGTIDFPICSIILDEAAFEPAKPCRATRLPAAPNGETALALGVAHYGIGELRRAQSLLRSAGWPDDPAFRRLLLRARAQVADGLGALEARESRAADSAYLSALADYRALAVLEPDDVEVQFMIGMMLEELGDYAAARTHYEDILRRWPEEDFRIAVRIGALYRTQGDYQRALEQLDRLVERSGPQGGMKFHYHRAWTLTLLGRFEETVAEIGKGLPDQPDYSYAYLRRGCALASLGRLDEALADIERGAALLKGLPQAGVEPLRFDISRAEAIVAQLEEARSSRPRQPVTGTCEGYWAGSDVKRQRSALLPPA